MPQKPPRQTAKELLLSLASGSGDAFETYRGLYHLWLTQNAAVPELQPLFEIPGIGPNGQISVTEDFRSHVRSFATTERMARVDRRFQRTVVRCAFRA